MSPPNEPLGTNRPKSESHPTSSEVSFQAGQRVGGKRFRLERPLGRGRLGMAWRAFDEQANEPVVLKFLAEKIVADPAALAALKREVSRIRPLRHPHIVRIHDWHERASEPAFLSLEHIDGATLDDLSRERAHRAFSWEEVCEWMRQLGSALSHAHSRGIIHRDLTPANLMLNSRGELKLMEFGLAPTLKDVAGADDQTITEVVPYLSPQQLMGVPAAVTDDIYSLGACLFRLLTGVPPFRGSEMRKKIQSDPAPSLAAVAEERGVQRTIPEGLEAVCLQCLSKNPQERPQTVETVLEMIGESLEDGGLADDSPVGKRRSKSARWRRKLGSPWTIGAISAGAVLVFALKFVLPSSTSTPARTRALDLRSAPVQGSSDELSHKAEGAFDGFHKVPGEDVHRWVSAPHEGDHSEWITVDLGKDMQVDWIAVDWELAYAKDFSVRTRTSAEGFVADPSQWTQQGIVTGFREVRRGMVHDSESKDDVVFDFERGQVKLGSWVDADTTKIEPRPIVARHIMINPTARGRNNPGVYSIFEVEVGAKPMREPTKNTKRTKE